MDVPRRRKTRPPAKPLWPLPSLRCSRATSRSRNLPRGADEKSACEKRVVGKESVNLLARDRIEGAHVGTAAGTGAADNIGKAVAIRVARGHADAAGEVDVVGEEAHEPAAVLAAEHGHVRSAASVGAAADVGEAVAIDVAGGHIDAAG